MGRGITRFWFAAVIAAAALLPTGCTPKCPPAPTCPQTQNRASDMVCEWMQSTEESSAKAENRCPNYSFVRELYPLRLGVV